MTATNMDIPADFTSIESIGSFVHEFRSGQLPKARWTHAAHLVAGLWHVLQYGPDRALEELRERIRAHNEALGTPNTDDNGYHETITRFYVVTLDQARRIHPERERVPETLYHAVLRSRFADSRLPLDFYRKETLFSVQARREWVEPDIAPIHAPDIEYALPGRG